MTLTVVGPRSEDVQWLADHRRGDGPIVSCYADLSVSSGVRSVWRQRLRVEVKGVLESLDGGPGARPAFERNIAVVQATLARHALSTRGMAVFAAAERGLLMAYALSVPLPNRLVVSDEPYLMPLLELLNRQRRYLVVHTNTHRGRLYTAVPGAADLIEEIKEDVPKRHRASGERWGKQQATIVRHRKNHVLHYVKELVREIERVWPGERYDGIVLLGEHEVLQELRRHLPESLARHIVGGAPHAWAGRQMPLESKIGAIHAEILHEHDRRLLEEATRRLLEQHRIAAGPQAVVDALRNNEIGFPGSIIMEPDRGEAGARCPGCGVLFAQIIDTCPFCRKPCLRANLWQAIALLAARYGVPVHVVAGDADLRARGGVVALLSRGEA